MNGELPQPENPNFVELLALARAGNPWARGRLFEDCRGYLMAIARRELHGCCFRLAEADDLVQQTYLQAQLHFDQFHGSTENCLCAWLARSLRRFIAKSARREKIDTELQASVLKLDDAATFTHRTQRWPDNPADMAVLHEEIRSCRRAIRALAWNDRVLLNLHFNRKMSWQAIAAFFSTTPDAVRKRRDRIVQDIVGKPTDLSKK